VLRGLLQPVADGVLEQLVPHHRARAHGVNASTGSSEVPAVLRNLVRR
jgi:hypothetical protein